MFPGILFVAILLCCTIGESEAAPIPGLFNSGVGANGALLPGSSVDPHYRLIQSADPSAPGPNAIVINEGWPIAPASGGPWLANGPNSKWISPLASQATGNAAGDYRYRLVFDLTGLEPSTAVITGRWTSDNAGAGIFLNGAPTGITYDGNFGAFSPVFTINSGFVEGSNTLDFVVNNAGTTVNPTGLRVEVSGTAEAQPPPGTPPSITRQPSSQTNGLGDSVTFSVLASGSRPFTYQWRRNGTAIAGATNATYTINGLSAASAGVYDVVVSNPWGTVTSAPARLEVVFIGLNALSYEPPGPSSRRTGLAITEVMYHPKDRADARNVEFIEIYNSNPFFEDVSGYRLDGDVHYTFPSNTVLQGNSYLVVAPVPADVQAVYGITGVIGGFTNSLPNDGGRLRLRKRSGAVVLDIEYSDQPPWPVAADGAGHSLVLARPSFGEGNVKAWEASAWIGGSAGAADPVPGGPLEHVVINEILAHGDVNADFIELYNHSLVSVDISGCFLSDERNTNKFRVPTGIVLQPREFVAFTETELGFSLSASGETVYFVNSNGTRVVDALRFSPMPKEHSWGRYPDGAPEFFVLGSGGTPGETNDLRGATALEADVAISEIMYNSISGDSDDEYVELYNRGSAIVDLSGWRFTAGIDFTFPSNALFAPNSYVVVARDAARLLTNHPGLNPGQVFGNFSGNLSNGGERLALARPERLTTTNVFVYVVVNEVTYGTGGRWPKWADGGGSSLELIDVRGDNRLASNWADSDETSKAPWTLVERTGALDMPHPANPSADQLQVFLQGAGEALIDDVEVVPTAQANRIANGTFESGTTSWTFQGTHRLSGAETAQGFNSARSLRLRATERGDHVANRARVPLTSPLAGGTATLRAKARWLRGHPELLMRLKGNHLEAIGRLTIPSNLGTPGAPNSQARANSAPAIFEVSHRPVLPAADQAIRVAARVSDHDGVAGVSLRYRLDPSATLTTITMVDNGTAGDLLARDGIYTGVIPGQPNGTMIAFHIAASDGFGPAATARFPSDAPTRECLVRVGETPVAGSFGTYRFWMTQASVNFWASREKMSNEDVDGTFVYGTNRVVYNAGAHYSGSSYTSPIYNSPIGALCGYDINFADDDLVLGDNHFTLDWPIRDATDQREQLMFWFLEQYGLPNMHRRYVHLFVNGVRRGTIYDDVQQPDGSSVESWFPEDSEGSLHKTDCWSEFSDDGTRLEPSGCTLNSLENFVSGGVKKVARYRWNWRPRAVRGTANDFSDLFALVDAVNAQGPAYQSAVESVVDVEHWMRTFAMNDLASFWDAFGNPNAKNTYLYKPENEGWKLFCWDFDVGLGVFNDPVNDALFPANVDPTVMRMYNFPAFVRAYWRAIDEAVNTFFQPSAVDPILGAKYAAFQVDGINLTSPFVPSGAYGLSISGWIAQRRSFLQTQLASVAANFTVAGATNYATNRNLVTISGTAPVRVQTIMINGVAYAVTWTSTTAWIVRVPVVAGTNTLEVQALDRLGNAIAGMNRTITVDYSGADVSPDGTVIINEIMYNPAFPEASYVELYNTSTNYAFDLSGWELNGIGFTFPNGAIITNQQFLILAKNRQAFAAAYGNTIPVFGEFGGQLDDGGETLTLVRRGASNEELVVDRVTYDDDMPWPSAADGNGAALQLIDARQDNNRVSNWSDSAGWRFYSYTGNTGLAPTNKLAFFFDTGGGDIYLDDISFVAGNVPEVGTNHVSNGGFESTLSPPWMVGPLATNSAITTTVAHSGNASLHLVVNPGSQQVTTFYQDMLPVNSNTVYTLSFWYLPGSRGTNFNARLNSTYRTLLTLRAVRFTPGASNNVVAELPPFPPLWLSEVQPWNITGARDNAGEAEPWVELFNSGSNQLDTAEYFLSDNYTDLTRWAFPSGSTVNAREFRLVWTDGEASETTGAEWHANFRLNPTNGAVVLSRLIDGVPQILDYINYSDVGADRSFGSYPDGQLSFRRAFDYPTPRATNNAAVLPATVFINEWMAANASFLFDPADSDFDDWFELYNPTTNVIDLAGYTLTDALADPTQFTIPAGITIPTRGFLLVWADEETGQTRTNGDLHVNFRLGQGGDAIGLFDPAGRAIDTVTFGSQTNNISQGRWRDGASAIYYMRTPTPRAANVLPNGVVQVNSIQFTAPNAVTITWQSEAGHVYRVQFKNDLADAEWSSLPGDVEAVQATASKTDISVDGVNQRFYRIQLLQ
jgi:hypothetical protein